MSQRWPRRALLVAACGALLLLIGTAAWEQRPPPLLLIVSPASAAQNVPLAAPLGLTFSQPMDRASVAGALRLTPDQPLNLSWNADSTALTLRPTTLLRADTSYTLTVSTTARSRLLRPLAASSTSFRTAPAPEVTLRFPSEGAQDVRPDAPLVLVFSRPMVAPAAVGAPIPLPQLTIEPPLSAVRRWLDPQTLLIRPETLRPATSYTVTLATNLTDQTNLALAAPLRWRFATAAPQLLTLSPADGTREVNRAAPLVLRVSQPLELNALRAGLIITPTTAGTLAASTLPNATQLITFTPTNGWQAGGAYAAQLGAGIAPQLGERPLPGPVRWSFRVASAPQIVGRFPGPGQRLPPGQSLRLVFSTPFAAETIRAAATITPTIGGLRVLTSGNEARFSGDLRADTTYTLTLPADLSALSGETLGITTSLHIATDRALPQIAIPAASGHVVQVAPLTPTLQVDARGVTALAAELYRLDQTTAVRTFGFGPDDWRAFSPQRYGLRLLRSWTTLVSPTGALRLDLTDPPGAALAPGFYSLRLRAAEGPQTDLLLVASDTRLTLLQGTAGTLLLARNLLTAAPLVAAPISLYQNGALVAVTGTDAAGVALVGPVGDPRRPLLALLDGPAPALSSADWGDPPPPPPAPSVTLLTDRERYQPGQRVLIAGFAPPGTASGRVLTLRAPGQTEPLTTSVTISPSGVISAALDLPAALAPGVYQLNLALDAANLSRALSIDPSQPPLQLRIAAPPLPGQTLPITFTATTRWGAPAAGAVISWTLTPEPPLIGAPLRGGSAHADPQGHVTFVLTDALTLERPLTLRLTAAAADPGAEPVRAEQLLTLTPAVGTLTAQLERRVWAAGTPQTLTVTAVRGDGEPYASLALRADLIRRVWQSGAQTPDETVVLERTLRTDAEGRALLPLTLSAGGEYSLRISATRANGPAPTEVTAWVAAPGFTGWRPAVGDQVPLITDQTSYRAGDVVTLLAAAPLPSAEALLALRRGAALRTITSTLRAGTLITLTLAPDDPPTLELTALISAPGRTLLAETPIRLAASQQQLRLGLQAEPGPDPASATLVFSTTDTLGRPLAADLVLALSTGEPPAAPAAAPVGLPSVAWVGGATHRAQAAPPVTALPLSAPPAMTLLWRSDLRSAADGTLRLTVPLSGTGQVIAAVWAVTPGRQVVSARLGLRAGGELAASSAAPRPNPPASASVTAGAVLERRLLDPASGRLLDPQQLQAGQLVAVQLLLITPTQPRGLTLHEPPPSWGDLVGPGEGDFDQVVWAVDGLTLRRTSETPGVVQHRYLVRVGPPGSYGPASLADEVQPIIVR